MSEDRAQNNGIARGQLDPSGSSTPCNPQLAACLLLAGGLKPSPLAAATGVSPLDLHITGQSTVMDWWLDRFASLSESKTQPLDVRIIHGIATPAPAHPRQAPAALRVNIEHETRQYRGPAGIARDACSDYPEDAVILIAEAGRLVAADLQPVVEQHHRRSADITVVCNADSSPAGIFLAMRSTLDLVPRIGFMDLKEQWLTKAVTQQLHVRVHRLAADLPSYELRTAAQFRAAAQAASSIAPPQASDAAAGEAGKIQVSSDTVVVDSVIMPGAVVEQGCVIVRSIICPGARVLSGTTVMDQVVRCEKRGPRRVAGRHASRD